MDNVEGLDELRTFGWSLSGGVDVDNNQYGGEAGEESERKGKSKGKVGKEEEG